MTSPTFRRATRSRPPPAPAARASRAPCGSRSSRCSETLERRSQAAAALRILAAPLSSARAPRRPHEEVRFASHLERDGGGGISGCGFPRRARARLSVPAHHGGRAPWGRHHGRYRGAPYCRADVEGSRPAGDRQPQARAWGGLAMAEVAKAPPDGYTLAMITQGTHVFNVGLYKSLRYD